MAAPRAGVILGADTPTLPQWHSARYAEALHADWKHGPRLTRSTSSKNLNEIKNKLRIKKKKARQKAAVEPPRRAALTFVVLLLLLHDISKRKKVTSTECLQRDVRLEVSVQVKPFTYDVA